MKSVLKVIVKKEYAASLLEHLTKEDAIEIIDKADSDIPEWQKDAVRKTLKEVEENPSSLQAWDDVRKKYQKQA